MIDNVGVDERVVRMVESHLKELPILNFIGLEFVWLERGKAISRVRIDPARHRNPNGVLNGCVLTAMADTTTGFAAYTCGHRVCTVSDENQYLRSGKLDGEITCTAQVVKEGKTLIWTEARICDDTGTLIMKGEYLYYRLGDL